jgi:hypothetical protein
MKKIPKIENDESREAAPRIPSAMQALYLALNDVNEFERQVLANMRGEPLR